MSDAIGLDELIDEAWLALRGSLFRRAVMGKQRCAEIVMLTLAHFPDRELKTCLKGSAYAKQAERTLAETVERKYRASHVTVDGGTYGMVFLTIVLTWAVEAIVRYLLAQWWKKHFDAEQIRRRYGWQK